MSHIRLQLRNATARRYFMHANDVHEDGSLCCYFSNGGWGFWVRPEGTVDVDSASADGTLPSKRIVDSCVRAAVKFLWVRDGVTFPAR